VDVLRFGWGFFVVGMAVDDSRTGFEVVELG
jgi:hypothetical protein